MLPSDAKTLNGRGGTSSSPTASGLDVSASPSVHCLRSRASTSVSVDMDLNIVGEPPLESYVRDSAH
jgi:hypothetical protein